MGSEIRGVTFDFWNTIFQPGPILPARLRQALAFLREHGSPLTDAEIGARFAEAQELNDARWRAGQHFGGDGVARHLLAAALGSVEKAQVSQLLDRFQSPADISELVRPVPGVDVVLAASGRRAVCSGSSATPAF